MSSVKQVVFNCGIMPLIKPKDAEEAVVMCKALAEGGVYTAEINFGAECFEAAVKAVNENLPDYYIGACGVFAKDNVKTAVNSGAKFISLYGFNKDVIEYCQLTGFTVFPGVSSPSDIENAVLQGFDMLRFYHAGAQGGAASLKALSEHYKGIKFIACGGIGVADIADYAKIDSLAACVLDLNEKTPEDSTKFAKQAVCALHGFRFAHVGINLEDHGTAVGVAGLFNQLFSTGFRETAGGAFAGDFIEVMGIGKKAMGTTGHIGFRAHNVLRAIAYFERLGYEFNYDTMLGTKENPTFIYLKKEIGGYAIHIVK